MRRFSQKKAHGLHCEEKNVDDIIMYYNIIIIIYYYIIIIMYNYIYFNIHYVML